MYYFAKRVKNKTKSSELPTVIVGHAGRCSINQKRCTGICTKGCIVGDLSYNATLPRRLTASQYRKELNTSPRYHEIEQNAKMSPPHPKWRTRALDPRNKDLEDGSLTARQAYALNTFNRNANKTTVFAID